MTPVGNNNASSLHATQVKATNTPSLPSEAKESFTPLKVEQNKVSLSDEGKALLSALQQIDKEAKEAGLGKPTTVESFTHGALGLDHPEKIEETEDTSYTAGQYLKGALSAGAILLALL
ncbi:hypothetical protein [Vibrio algarum]|uniref:Uncharacterized protein n=1 Tax=Vibrio algarum TaxID=3020714 RepID=A0ABT4YPQ6_9VIBR|nr:hypothetical protein [Vibrio sp. KJ40-1]MDB1123377.1 hypothetical protein [Vibrio sp. KJ40-1]